MKKPSHFWIEIVALGTAVAFALALLIATLGAAAIEATGHAKVGQASEAAPDDSQTYEGMITDTRCGARHDASLGKTASDCVRICVRSGDSFALISGEKTYQLDGDLAVLKKVAGRRARVVGIVRGSTIKVASVTVAS